MDNNIKVPKQSTISIWSLEGMGSIWYHSIGSSLLVLYCLKTRRGEGGCGICGGLVKGGALSGTWNRGVMVLVLQRVAGS